MKSKRHQPRKLVSRSFFSAVNVMLLVVINRIAQRKPLIFACCFKHSSNTHQTSHLQRLSKGRLEISQEDWRMWHKTQRSGDGTNHHERRIKFDHSTPVSSSPVRLARLSQYRRWQQVRMGYRTYRHLLVWTSSSRLDRIEHCRGIEKYCFPSSPHRRRGCRRPTRSSRQCRIQCQPRAFRK